MMNDIQVTFENQQSDVNLDDDWDPMREEYEDSTKNSYDCGPGANLDLNLQRPKYRDKNNQPVFKLMIRNFPKGLNEEGLKNLLALCGDFNVLFCKKSDNSFDHIMYSLVECKTLREANSAIKRLEGIDNFKLSVGFARSDEETVRLKKQRKEDEEFYNQISVSLDQMEESPQARQEISLNPRMLRMLGRGSNRGRLIVNAHREFCERQAGARSSVWSKGNPDISDPGGLIHKYKSNRHEVSNRYLLENIVVQRSDSSRKVSMGRAYVPALNETHNSASSYTSVQRSVGEDIQVPLLQCTKCSSLTVLKCLTCGTPYCSTKCQKEDFNRHRPLCRMKESIDVLAFNESLSQKVAPLTRKIAKVDPISSATIQSDTLFWGKPEKCVLSMLRWGTQAIIEVTSHHNAHFSGFLCCEEVCEIAEKLLMSLPNLSKNPRTITSYWPPVGTLVAVRCDDSVWRGYVINAPIIGSSTQFTVALCDLGKLQTVDVQDIFPLPSEYQSLLELAVTCNFVTSQSELLNSVKEGTNLTVKVESSTDTKATAKVLDPDGAVLGEICILPWEPTSTIQLAAVHFSPPCRVLLTAYHNQCELYVRPIGRAFEDQFFTLMQKVAAVHVTSPPLGRPPYREEMVACQYRKDGNFYRAVIFGESRTTPNEYSAFFVDFGNTESVSLSEMKALPHDLKKLPCMAVKVSLKDVRQGPLTDNAIQYLNHILQKRQELQLVCPHRSEDGVELISTRDNISLNSHLNEFLMPDWENLKREGKEPHGGEVFMLEENTNVLPLIDGKSGVVHIFVNNIMMDGRLAVCPTEPHVVEHVLQTLTFQVNEYCESTDPQTTYHPRIDEICLARFKDGMWYRAVNMRDFSNSCEVLFLDYGNLETVEFKNIRRMVRDFVNIPTLMSFCSIDGVPDKPTESMVKRVHELVPVNKTYEVQVLEAISTGEYKISIPEISNQLRSEFST